ncbi:LOW QUALITY PROTEIN: complexin-4c [Xyrauchen texanus]|uniref:LOW QUALITY PROTEIN: complexin-4c n=1 Tax=Xyrauchen texanus TaxID=154827 RepID=UPI002241C821|nr:LOW QUALITY PROTEIN: complexin-4c [Xyrauchen texanus]
MSPKEPEKTAFLLQQMLGDKLKNVTGESDSELKFNILDVKETAASKGMSREEFDEYQKQLIEEKIVRDKEFATSKAERANLRVLLRDKYRIPETVLMTQLAHTVHGAINNADNRSIFLALGLKGILHAKKKILPLFASPDAIPDVYDCVSSAGHK